MGGHVRPHFACPPAAGQQTGPWMVEPDSTEPIWRDIAVSVGTITASDARPITPGSVDFESAHLAVRRAAGPGRSAAGAGASC